MNNCFYFFCYGKTEGGEEIAALGHTEEVVAGKAATCTETGLTDGKVCTVCGVTTVAQTEIDPYGHDYKIIDHKEPTCVEDGYKYYECANDASHNYTEITSATGYTLLVDVIEKQAKTGKFQFRNGNVE